MCSDNSCLRRLREDEANNILDFVSLSTKGDTMAQKTLNMVGALIKIALPSLCWQTMAYDFFISKSGDARYRGTCFDELLLSPETPLAHPRLYQNICLDTHIQSFSAPWHLTSRTRFSEPDSRLTTPCYQCVHCSEC